MRTTNPVLVRNTGCHFGSAESFLIPCAFTRASRLASQSKSISREQIWPYYRYSVVHTGDREISGPMEAGLSSPTPRIPRSCRREQRVRTLFPGPDTNYPVSFAEWARCLSISATAKAAHSNGYFSAPLIGRGASTQIPSLTCRAKQHSLCYRSAFA